MLILTICIIGFLSFTKQILKFIKWVWAMLIRSPKKLTNYGSWALITGCTDGIGKALAFDLASDGLNLILIGRNPLKLEATSNEILQKHGKKNIEIKIIVIDFTNIIGEEIEVKISEEIQGLDVGVLVNNVGSSSSKAKFFHEIDFQGMHDLINVNLNSVTWVTRAVLPGMLKKRKGAIVNIGSGSTCVVPSYPLFTMYAATKGYVAMFSRSLSVEYQQYGIDVQCQIPLLVATKMASIKKSSFFIPSPEQYSKASKRWIGFELFCVPYWTHALQWCLISSMPESVVNWLLLRYFLSLRKKMIQKELRQKK
ncbi:very-long-chain 3-oxoacyl-CoA reductase 1-like [Silene latifolia]|uniref:very-long-chain 3-oxoacyl-CoA reductase 1-like n=1 Tax=Silene latifolia TaxID=37657 RepID=UPI003D77ED19